MHAEKFIHAVKKIIALSTLRQLGVIIFTIRIQLPDLAFFHLITHALFKALLFICAGYLINIHHHSQDLRTIGNLAPQLPVISSTIVVSNFALCGIPFIAGFYSKDTIIEIFMSSNKNSAIILIFILATTLTSAYSTRFIIHLMLSPTRRPSIQCSYETPRQYAATIALASGAVIGGALIN